MMDIVQLFNDELQSLVDMKPPVSKAKMGQITKAAMKGVKFYKHIVKGVEKFIVRCGPEYKVPGLYVIDSIVRQSRHQFGVDRDVYAARFSNNLDSTFQTLFSGCMPDDKPKIVRVLNLWQKNGVFESHVIQPLLDMASPNATLPMDPKSPSYDNNNSFKQGQTSKYLHQYSSGSNSNTATGRHNRTGDGGLKFTKNMLDFDYDEEDDDGADETPTEAEPPLSSTLNKIEMEQRNKRGDKTIDNNISYQSSQKSLDSDKFHTQQRSNQDPVLERWNRLLRQQSGELPPIDQTSPNNNSRRRSRSRSPQTSYSSQQTSASRAALYTSSREIAQPQPTSFQNSSREAERLAERERKCLPKIRDKHLTVCSSTLWLGHVPKLVSEADISDAFGEFGTINSIDLIPPRGCAYVCMDRRQDAKRALNESKHLKLNGSHIKMAWAPGKGFKEYKKLKDFWEADLGASFIPYSKVDESIDFDTLEEGGVIDEDSMSLEMRERREKRETKNEEATGSQDNQASQPAPGLSLPLPVLPMLNQPPPPPTSLQPFTIPPPNMSIPPPLALSQGVIPFPPPGVMTTAPSSGHIRVPPPTTQSTGAKLNVPDFDNQREYDANPAERGISPPTSIDQQLTMTERQISMVEQQLSMIQQAQGMGQLPSLGHMQALPPQAMFFPQAQPNPMMFDLPPPGHMMHGGQPMLDPQQMAMFMNPMHMLGQPSMMQMNPMSMMDPSEMNSMSQNQRDL